MAERERHPAAGLPGGGRKQGRSAPKRCQTPYTGPVSKVPLPRRLLLGLYAVVPAAIGAALVDGALLGCQLRHALPPLPDHLPYWTLVFNLPHVVASTLLLADREYLAHYHQERNHQGLRVP